MVTDPVGLGPFGRCPWSRTLVSPPAVIETLSTKLLHGRTGPAVYRLREAAHRLRRPSPTGLDRRIVDAMRTDGAYVTTLDELGFLANDRLLADIKALLPTLPTAEEHAAEGDPLVGRNTALHCFSVDPPQLADEAPGVLLWGLEPRLLDIAEAYLGVPPAFTSVHLRKDVGNGRQVGTRLWHIDTEDLRVIRVLIYLDDVTIDSGPFEYIPRPHSDACTALRERAKRSDGDPILDDEMRAHVPEAHWRPCVGLAGTVVIADNAAVYHHGRVHERERLALIYTYTSRHPLYPKLRRNRRFDEVLSERQRSCFFVSTDA